jgi:hypothetical protein
MGAGVSGAGPEVQATASIPPTIPATEGIVTGLNTPRIVRLFMAKPPTVASVSLAFHQFGTPTSLRHSDTSHPERVLFKVLLEDLQERLPRLATLPIAR